MNNNNSHLFLQDKTHKMVFISDDYWDPMDGDTTAVSSGNQTTANEENDQQGINQTTPKVGACYIGWRLAFVIWLCCGVVLLELLGFCI